MDKSVDEIARLVAGKVIGDGHGRVTGVNGIREAGAGELTFLSDRKYLPYFKKSKAEVILVDPECPATDRPLIQVENPYTAFIQILEEVDIENLRHPDSIHPTAVVADNVRLGKDVALGAHVYVGDDSVIGDGVVLHPGVVIGHGCLVGPNTIIHSNVSIRERVTIGARCIIHMNTAIGGDGFGFMSLNGSRIKVPQVGTVEIGDDVEIGANSAIDRATCGATRVGDGTKIDNLVQIAHNAQIGKHCVIASGTGIAGSAIIGDHVTFAGQSGAAGHIEIGDNVIVAGRGGVTKSVPPNRMVSGYPAVDHDVHQRILASQRQLPDSIRKLREMEKRLARLEEERHG